MLPGKNYTVDDIARILRRRVWFVVVPAAVVAAGVSLWAHSLPDSYRSQTTILIVPQRISESIVRPTVTARVEDRLASIAQEILSRGRLESLIEEFDLYADELATTTMEEVVTRMRDVDIKTRPIRNDAFELSYVGNDPVKVMRVTERLGKLFIDRSASYRHNLATDTDEFLDSELELVRRELEERENKLETYRRTYAGHLPSDVPWNLQQVTVANSQIQSAQEAINRGMERRLFLDGRIADLEKPGTGPVVVPLNPDEPVVAGNTLQQLTAAQAAVAKLETRGLRPGHPDLEYARRQVRELEDKWTAELAAAAVDSSKPVPTTISPAEATRLARLAEARAELADVNKAIARAREDEEKARAAAAAAQARIEAAPAHEAQMLALNRDYDIIESSYRSLRTKREDTRISANLERRQVGESFNVIEPARLPERPFEPQRVRIYVIGIALGLCIGFGLVGLIEYRDRSFRTDEDLALVLDLPVLAVVPLMQSEQDRRREIWRRLAIAAGCSTIVLACAVVFVYALVG